MNKNIEQICKDFNILYAEIINVDSMEKQIWGDIDALPYKGLYKNLLSNEGTIKNLADSFEKEDKPQTWRQGKLVLAVFKKQTDLVCMFYVTEKTGLESFEYAESIMKCCCEADNL